MKAALARKMIITGAETLVAEQYFALEDEGLFILRM